jgi:RES domain-containing protein
MGGIAFSHLRRGGVYYRVCDPSWTDPSDTSFSRKAGGRWNAPDRPGRPGFGALYLNRSLDAARANARRHSIASFGATLDDLADEHLPDLQNYDVTEADFVDAVTSSAVEALGLAASYPTMIPHPPCQGIAEDAYAKGEHGIVALSATSTAAAMGEEELVIFDRDVDLLATKTVRAKFVSWY